MIPIHYFLGKNEETTLCWLWSFFCLLGMCLLNRQLHQVVLFIDFVAAVWISGFLSFSSLDEQTRARMHRWWWWWGAVVGGRAVPWRKETALLGLRGVSFDWVSHVFRLAVWLWDKGVVISVLVPCAQCPWAWGATCLRWESVDTGLGLKTAFIQQSVNCAHNRCLRRCISVWLVSLLDWILQSSTHISKGRGRDSCLGLW